jgi:hypothetical protein
MQIPRDNILRSRFALLCLLCSATGARGSLWESPGWAVTGSLDGAIGYDSNLTASHDGPEDFFAVAKPYLTFLRRNSSTDFSVNGGVTQTEFVNHRQPTETDLAFDTILAYPNAADNLIPIYRAEASWQRSSQANQYLGERVPVEQAALQAEGYLPLTGKLGVRGTTALHTANYEETRLNNNSRGEAFVGLTYQRIAQTEISINLGTAYGHSKPNDPARVESDVSSAEYYLTTRLRGEITAKITGSVYGGLGMVDYTGGYVKRDSLPVGGADLTWGLDPRRTLVLAAYSGAQYAPDGQAVTTTRAFLSFTHVIINRWQYSVRAGPTHSVYSREVRERTDDAWDAGAEFAYRPSDRFRVSLSFNYTKQNSDISVDEFERDVTSLGASYHF